MRTKYILTVIITTSICFGVTISGCNRNRNTALLNKQNRQRPAEVLASTASRIPVQAAVYTQPLPPAAPPPAPYYQQVPIIIYPTPDIAIAEATAPQYVQQPVTPQATPRYRPVAPAPIPELEPSRYTAKASSIPAPATASARQQASAALRPLQPVVFTPAPQRTQQTEIQPLPYNGWVASPTTAMRSGF